MRGAAARDLPGDPGLVRTELRNARGPFVGSPGPRPVRRFARDAALDRVLLELQSGFGPQSWWPAETPFEVLVGAVLTQNTAWRNVELALAGLRRLGALTPGRLLELEDDVLESALRPSGFFRAKARKLRALSRHYLAIGGLRGLTEGPLERVRGELLDVHGIGPETADSILGYAAGRPTVIVDAYARRVLGRHGLLDPDLPYEAVRAWLSERLLPDPVVREEFHALCVRVGYDHCKPKPRCESCPARRPGVPVR